MSNEKFLNIKSSDLAEITELLDSRYKYADVVCAIDNDSSTTVEADLFYVFDNTSGNFVRRVIDRSTGAELTNYSIIECSVVDSDILPAMTSSLEGATIPAGGDPEFSVSNSIIPDVCDIVAYRWMVVCAENEIVLPLSTQGLNSGGIAETDVILEYDGAKQSEYLGTGVANNQARGPNHLLRVLCIIEGTCDTVVADSGVVTIPNTVTPAVVCLNSSTDGTSGQSITINDCSMAQALSDANLSVNGVDITLYGITAQAGQVIQIPAGTLISETYGPAGGPFTSATITWDNPADPNYGSPFSWLFHQYSVEVV